MIQGLTATSPIKIFTTVNIAIVDQLRTESVQVNFIFRAHLLV